MLLAKILEKENNNFDIIRLIAAMMVIYGHSYALSPEAGKSDVISNLINFDYSGSLAVKIFFFLSGLVVSNSLFKNKNISSFVVSRVFRIIPALCFVTAISAFIIGPVLSSNSMQSYFSNAETYTYFYKNILLHPQWVLPGVFDGKVHTSFNGSLWTLPYEALAYALTLVTFIIIGFNNKKLATLIGIVIIIDPLMGNKIVFSWIDASNNEISLLAPCFALGVLFALWKDKISINKTLIISMWVLYYIIYKSPHAVILFYASLFITLIYLSTTPLILKLRLPADVSYGVYLWGWPVQQIFSHIIPNAGILTHQLLSIFASVILGAISWFLIEKKFISIGKKTASIYAKTISN